jgi:hypothetical protein
VAQIATVRPGAIAKDIDWLCRRQVLVLRPERLTQTARKLFVAPARAR